MVYILSERKFFINIDREDRKFDGLLYDAYDKAEEAFNAIDDNAGLSIQAYDTPLYHGDYKITRRRKQKALA